MKQLDIINPKRKPLDHIVVEDERIFQYYAGYSFEFSDCLLASADLSGDSLIIDPWNGGGTTTAAAYKRGFNTLGFDLNPAMVVVAKAKLFSRRDLPSMHPLLDTILNSARSNPDRVDLEDPLCSWFTGSTAAAIRRIERAIHKVLINANYSLNAKTIRFDVDGMSDLAAFFYVACFRATRRLVSPFTGSNPTWIKRATCAEDLLHISPATVIEYFREEVSQLVDFLGNSTPTDDECEGREARIQVGNAEQLPVEGGCTDFVLTSPPYCTRIDYAVATLPELAVLGYTSEAFDALRRSLMGTSTVPKNEPTPDSSWGSACNELLGSIRSHYTKASSTYYYKNLAQYFQALRNSSVELERVLRTSGRAVVVVQDSYYKDLHINLADILSEMLEQEGLSLFQRADFGSKQTMAGLNSRARKYVSNREPIESVLCFVKEAKND